MNAEQQIPDSRLERAFLGSLLIVGNETAQKALRVVSSSTVLTSEAHRYIYEAIARVVATGADPDLVLVAHALDGAFQMDRAGGAAYVSSLVDDLPCADNIIFYAKEIRETAILRKAMRNRGAKS